MQIKYFSRADSRPPTPVAVFGWYEGDKKLPSVLQQIEGYLGEGTLKLLQSGEFSREENEWREVFMPGAKIERIFLLGLGKREKLTADKVRKFAGTVQKRMDALKLPEYTSYVATCIAGQGDLPISTQVVYQCSAEGALLASYLFRGAKSDDAPKRVKTQYFFAPKSYETDAHRGEIIAGGTMLARDLVNSPANLMTPSQLADAAKKMARQTGLTCEVWERSRIEREKMGLFLGVARGSVEDPRFVILEYGKPRKGRGPLVLVGKGVTFDTGGISIKPAAGMEQMKYDMSGAAAVIGAMHNIAMLKPAAHVVGIFPATENMPGGKATKPGDVHVGRSGKSVEIINTDAEGRLILADALDYAKTYKPSAVVDAATLTGACVIALGTTIGLMGNDAKLMQAVKEASEFTGERAWELPMFDDYANDLKSEVADLKNVSGGRGAGTITAAKFLEKFTEYPWVHCDVAGAAWEDKDHPYRVKGGTGIAVRLFTEIALNWFR